MCRNNWQQFGAIIFIFIIIQNVEHWILLTLDLIALWDLQKEKHSGAFEKGFRNNFGESDSLRQLSKNISNPIISDLGRVVI